MEKEMKIKGYWICYICATELGGKWPKGHVATVSEGVCDTCEGKKQVWKIVAPYVDYDWEDPAFTGHCMANRD